MTDVELVIKIPYHYYENNIDKELPIVLSKDNIIAMLPKGHGRLVLVDADALEECNEIMTTISGESKYAVRMDDIRNISTIIEADKEV